MDGVDISGILETFVGPSLVTAFFWKYVINQITARLTAVEKRLKEADELNEKLRLANERSRTENRVLIEILQDRDPASVESRKLVELNHAMLTEMSQSLTKIATSVQHFEKVYKECQK